MYVRMAGAMFGAPAGRIATILGGYWYNGEDWYRLRDVRTNEVFHSPVVFWTTDESEALPADYVDPGISFEVLREAAHLVAHEIALQAGVADKYVDDTHELRSEIGRFFTQKHLSNTLSAAEVAALFLKEMRGAMAETERDAPRIALFILDSERDAEGNYIPCIAEENTPGYYPTTWRWGSDRAVAFELAQKYNERLGLSGEDAFTIVMSSMVG